MAQDVQDDADTFPVRYNYNGISFETATKFSMNSAISQVIETMVQERAGCDSIVGDDDAQFVRLRFPKSGGTYGISDNVCFNEPLQAII